MILVRAIHSTESYAFEKSTKSIAEPELANFASSLSAKSLFLVVWMDRPGTKAVWLGEISLGKYLFTRLARIFVMSLYSNGSSVMGR